MNKGEINFNTEKHTLLLDVDRDSIYIPDFVGEYAVERGMALKPEYHITVIGYSAAEKIGEVHDLENLISETDWSFEVKNEFYHIKKAYRDEVRESVIMMVDVPALAQFIHELNASKGLNLEVPPAHVTLFSKSTLPENMSVGIGISSQDELIKFVEQEIFEEKSLSNHYHTIALPTRPQPDTIVAIFILKHFGEKKFPGIGGAGYLSLPRLPEGETEESLAKQGIVLIDIGGGMLDHHKKSFKTTASNLVAGYLGVKDNPALTKLLQFAERDDFYGKGIISNDPLDRAFGLSGLVASLNKKHVTDPEVVIEATLPLIDAHYTEEEKRNFEMPREVEEKLSNGQAKTFTISQRGKNLKCILMDSDNVSMAGFLRSKLGGGYDVVALRLSSGHINILTKPVSKVDLRSLAVLIRLHEGEARGDSIDDDPKLLSAPGIYKRVPNWYYDNATNSLLNGGPNPQGVLPTAIGNEEFTEILENGLSEKLWRP